MRILSIPVLLLFATVASAELPSQRLDRITPLGSAAGSSVEVEIIGATSKKRTACCSIIPASRPSMSRIASSR